MVSSLATYFTFLLGNSFQVSAPNLRQIACTLVLARAIAGFPTQAAFSVSVLAIREERLRVLIATKALATFPM